MNNRGKTKTLFTTTSALGTWGNLFNRTVEDMSQFRYIIVELRYPAGSVFSSGLIPFDEWKSGRKYNAFYVPNQNACECKYINDTTIACNVVGQGMAVIGVY